MKRFTKIITILLLGGAIYFGVEGYRNYRLTQASYGSFEHPIQLDHPGRRSVIANLPGRSIFRPGGVLEIKVGKEQPISGKGTVTVIDGHGGIALEAKLEEFILASAIGGNSLRPVREFKTTNGGPYEIIVEVLEPFQNPGLVPQTLIVRHFVSGTAEMSTFLIPLVISSLMMIGAGGLILRARKVSRHSGIVTPAWVD